MKNIKKQVLLITLDSVRADHLSLYGYKRNTSPNLDIFAKDASIYLQCIAPGPYTLASIPSMFNGRYPIDHPLRFGFKEDGKPFNLRKNDLPIFNFLRRKGIKTAAFTSNIFTSRQYFRNFDKNFDFFNDSYINYILLSNIGIEITAEGIVNDTVRWIRQNKDSDFFLWLHLMDAHGPYVPTHQNEFPYNARKSKIIYRIINNYSLEYLKDYVNKKRLPGISHYQLQKVLRNQDGVIEQYEQKIDYYISKYDTGIYLMDKALKKLFTSLESSNILDSSLIMIHSDHGESMGENSVYFDHGLTSTYEIIRTPLIIRSPKFKKEKIKKPVSLAGVMKTIFNYYNLQYKEHEVISAIEDQTENETIFSFGPKNIALLINNTLYTIHNGSLSMQGNPEERLLNLTLSDRTKNNLIKIDDLYTKIYDFNKSSPGSCSQKIPKSILKIFENITKKDFI